MTRTTSPSRTGTHLYATEIPIGTGEVKIRSYVAVDDIGKVVNPLIVDGQVHGGLAQGIAQALFEEAIYDDEGNLTTTTMADYLLPSAADLPDFTTGRTEMLATTKPLGVKGVGEAGTIASTPGRGQLDPGRAPPVRHPGHRDAVHAGAGLAGAQDRAGERPGYPGHWRLGYRGPRGRRARERRRRRGGTRQRCR